MADNSEQLLSKALQAASNTTRRSLLMTLSQQGASRVTDLAKAYAMSLNAISKHIKVLESAKLVKRRTVGRTHLIEADLEQIKLIENWMQQLQSVWALRLDALDQHLNTGDKNHE